MSTDAAEIDQPASLLNEVGQSLLEAHQLIEKQARTIEILEAQLAQRKEASIENAAKAAHLAQALNKVGLCRSGDMEKLAQTISTDPIDAITNLFEFSTRQVKGSSIPSELVDKLGVHKTFG